MNGVIQTLKSAWDGRSQREQRLLAIMLLLLVGVLGWLLIVRPVFAWRADAAERRVEAAADLALVRSGLGRLAGAPSAMTPGQVRSAAQATADAAGLNIVFAPGDGGVGFTVQGARTQALFGWLATLSAQGGIEVRELTVSENADATVSADGLLVGPPDQSAR